MTRSSPSAPTCGAASWRWTRTCVPGTAVPASSKRLGSAFVAAIARAFCEVEAATGCTGRGCLYLGDNPRKDFVAARRRGWRTVRVRRPEGEHAALETGDTADHECTDLNGLVGLIGLSPMEERRA